MKAKKIIFFIKLLLFILLVILVINFISGYFSNRVKLYIKQKAISASSLLIASTISDEVLPNIDLNSLIYTVEKNNNIDSIYINTYQINNILALTTASLSQKLNNLSEENLLLKLPLGIILSDVLFYDIGPNINIKVYPVGAVKCDVKSVIEEYGINNSILKIQIVVNVSFVVIIPLQKDEINVTTSIPVLVQIIQGEVPRFYFNSKDTKLLPTN